MADLTPDQRIMLQLSGHDSRRSGGFGVELRGAGNWRIARRLVALGLGHIEGGHPNGSELPGLFFANDEGVELVKEPDSNPCMRCDTLTTRWLCPSCAADELWEREHYDQNEDNDDDWTECWMMQDGTCMKAGTEECDWECGRWRDV